MNLEGFNLSNVCRLCLRSSKDLKNIFAKELVDEQPKMSLAARIMACVALEVIFARLNPRDENVFKISSFNSIILDSTHRSRTSGDL